MGTGREGGEASGSDIAGREGGGGTMESGLSSVRAAAPAREKKAVMVDCTGEAEAAEEEERNGAEEGSGDGESDDEEGK